MAIVFKCSCGKALRAQDEHAGRKTRCVHCGNIVAIPVAKELPDAVKSPPPSSAKSSLRARPVLEQKSNEPLEVLEVEQDEEEEPRAKTPRKSTSKAAELDDLEVVDDEAEDEDYALIDEEEEEVRPRKKKKKKKARAFSSGLDFGFERSASNSGVLLGILMMVGAVVWFVVGLMNGWIFFYPPILFIVGLVAVVKGLMG